MKILGIMTGTSCDGLDAACAEFRNGKWNSLWSKFAPYPRALRNRVLLAQLPKARLSAQGWGELHRDLGLWMGRVAKRILLGRERPDAIAWHGQTVAHFPAAQKKGFTIQLGDPARIVQETGLTVISNFRDGDMAAGGQGAPLAPRFHKMLVGGARSALAIHNLGGISNLTYFGRHQLLAFDTGPGNIWIDAATELATDGKSHFDRDGKIARAHTPDFEAVERVLADPFFARNPPKSTGRDDFPFSKLLETTRVRDGSLVATATAITVESIARAYSDFVLKQKLPLAEIYFSGGGARNNFLMDCLRRRLSGIGISKIEDLGVDGRYLEATAFAYFGFLALQGCPIGGRWTGASGWTPPAHIIPGRNWPQIVRRLAREDF